MVKSCDVAVVGLGAMGSAILCELARRGQRVVGFDRHVPPHALGSSHGESRIIREAYFEHPQYVPLVQRAYARWADLETVTGMRLFVQTGGLMVGRAGGALVSGARDSASRHGLPYDVLNGSELGREYPAFAGTENFVALREPRAGVLFPERCIEAHLTIARRHGAVIRTASPVDAWRMHGDSAELIVGGERWLAGRLVLAPGAWMRALTPQLDLPLAVVRQVLHWFEPAAHADRFTASRFPVFLLEHDADTMLYGFPLMPDVVRGVKIAQHHEGRPTDPDAVDRNVGRDEVAVLQRLVSRYLPDLAGRWLRSDVCLYTNTPDFDFLIDWHPWHPGVLLVSACSGHGFKFSSAIGEVAADLVLTGTCAFDLTPFRYGRWRGTGST